jgi:hypothetical protein
VFRTYHELGAVRLLHARLDVEGVTSKWGQRLSHGALFHMLQNRVYRGEVRHKGNVYPGEHEAIIDLPLWDAVQTKLAENRVQRASGSNADHPSLLAGLAYDARIPVAHAFGPAVATSISATDSELIAAVCSAATHIPIIEVAGNTMLAQLQRACLCLTEQLGEHSLPAVMERVVCKWTGQVRARALEDEADWRKHFDAALAAVKQQGNPSDG